MMDVRLQMPSEVVRAVQPPELSAAFLHSEGTFVVVTAEQTFVWVSGQARSCATALILGLLQVGKASRLFPSHDSIKTLLLRIGRGATVSIMEVRPAKEKRCEALTSDRATRPRRRAFSRRWAARDATARRSGARSGCRGSSRATPTTASSR